MSFARDLAERTLATFVQAWLGLVVASWSGALDVGTLRAAAIAALPAALAVVKGGLARFTGNPDTAAIGDTSGPECPGATTGWDA